MNQALQIIEYKPTAAALAELEVKYRGIVFDVATAKGLTEAKAARAEIRGYRVDLEKMRKELKADVLEKGRLIDGEAKRITAELEALEEPIDGQIKAKELCKEQDRQAQEAALRAERVAQEAELKAKRKKEEAELRELREAEESRLIAQWQEADLIEAENKAFKEVEEARIKAELEAEGQRLAEEQCKEKEESLHIRLNGIAEKPITLLEKLVSAYEMGRQELADELGI